MDVAKLIALGVITLIAAFAADQGNDIAFRVHGFLIFAVAAGLFVHVLRNLGDAKPVTPQNAVAITPALTGSSK